jgi:hypothetical protein
MAAAGRAGRRREQDRPIGERGRSGHAHGLYVGRREHAVLGLVAGIHIADELTVLRGAFGRSKRGSGRFGLGGWRTCPAWALRLSQGSLASLLRM